MIYNDGVPMDDDLRVLMCPKCGNEQFSLEAEFCRICGFSLFNPCDGEKIYDSYGSFEEIVQHRNAGNARFCEKCGAPTHYYNQKLLLPYDELQEEYIEKIIKKDPAVNSGGTATLPGDDDDDDLPF